MVSSDPHPPEPPVPTADAPPATAPVTRARPDLRLLAAVAFTVLAWASAFVAIRGVGGTFSPGGLALGRLVIAAVMLSVFMATSRRWVRPTGREWLFVVVSALAWFAAYSVALNAAEQRVDAGTAAMIVNIGPILITLLAAATLGERITRWTAAGAGVAFAGVLVIGLATADADHLDVWGVALCVVAAVTYAIGVVAQKPAVRRLPALQVTWLSVLIATVACLPFAPDLARQVPQASPGALAGLAWLGAVSLGLAFTTWAYALQRMPAGRLGLTTYVVPPVTILLSWPLLQEVPPPLALAGGALCLVGVALTRRRSRRAQAPARAATDEAARDQAGAGAPIRP